MVASAMRLSYGRLPAILGLPIAGLLWSLATLHVSADVVDTAGLSSGEAFFLVSVGGLAQTLALWIGFTTVTWAMVRGFGGRLPLLRVAALVSGAALPLWLAAPVAAYWIQGAFTSVMLPAGVILISLAFFIHALARSLAADLGWSVLRAASALATTLIFLTSFTFLST